jgi:hypothetical protein
MSDMTDHEHDSPLGFPMPPTAPPAVGVPSVFAWAEEQVCLEAAEKRCVDAAVAYAAKSEAWLSHDEDDDLDKQLRAAFCDGRTEVLAAGAALLRLRGGR